MTSTAVALSTAPLLVDFTRVTATTYGTNAQRTTGGTFNEQALWSGDVNADGDVKDSGPNNDRDLILMTVGSTTPNTRPLSQFIRSLSLGEGKG